LAPRPEREPGVAGAQLAGILLLVEAAAGAACWTAAWFAIGFGLRWSLLLHPVAIGGLGAGVLALKRELRGIALFVSSVLALHPVVSSYLATREGVPGSVLQLALWDSFGAMVLAALGRVLPLARLLYGRPSATQRRVAALVMLAAIAVLYGKLLELVLAFART
jgi:hypothetical protein